MEETKKGFKYVIRFQEKKDDYQKRFVEFIEESPEIQLLVFIDKMNAPYNKKH